MATKVKKGNQLVHTKPDCPFSINYKLLTINY